MKLSTALLACCVLMTAAPEASAAEAPPPIVHSFAAFEGAYDFGEQSLYLVADSGRLAAVIGDAVYPLTHRGGENFTNPGGQAVKFERDRAGRILAVSDPNGRYPLTSTDVPRRVRGLLRPTPAGSPPWRYAPPQRREPDLPVGDAAQYGLPHARAEQLVRLITDDPAWSGVRSLLVYRRGRLILESYFYGFGPEDPHDLRSATKSVIATLAGTATRDGLIALDTPVWAELAKAQGRSVPSSVGAVTLGQVLDMQTGLSCDDYNEASPGGELNMMKSPDWVRFMLDVPPAPIEPGIGRYCSGAPISVGRLVELRSGKPLPTYAEEQLFRPLGIAPSRVRWDFSPTWKGSEHVAGLFMTPRDMLRFGRLHLRGGTHDGRRILPDGWTQTAFAAPVSVGSWRRYGRYWWTFPATDKVLGPAKTYRVHAAMGNGGQRVAVAPDYDAVIVMTGGNYNDSTPTDRVIAYLLRTFDQTPVG